MRCRICNNENGSIRKNPDGTYDCICADCMTVVYELLRFWKCSDEDKEKGQNNVKCKQ